MSLKSGQEKQRGKGPHLNGRSSLGGDSSSNVLKRSVESAINCESSKNGVLGRSCPARPPPSGCCGACIICRPLPLSLDMLIWAHAPGPPPATFKRPISMAPAGGRRYRFGAPCPRLIGSWLNLASPTRGRLLACFTCCLSPRQEQRIKMSVKKCCAAQKLYIAVCWGLQMANSTGRHLRWICCAGELGWQSSCFCLSKAAVAILTAWRALSFQTPSLPGSHPVQKATCTQK